MLAAISLAFAVFLHKAEPFVGDSPQLLLIFEISFSWHWLVSTCGYPTPFPVKNSVNP